MSNLRSSEIHFQEQPFSIHPLAIVIFKYKFVKNLPKQTFEIEVSGGRRKSKGQEKDDNHIDVNYLKDPFMLCKSSLSSSFKQTFVVMFNHWLVQDSGS